MSKLKTTAYRRDYYRRNRVRILALHREWRLRNQEKYATYQRGYSQQRKKSPPTTGDEIVAAAVQRARTDPLRVLRPGGVR